MQVQSRPRMRRLFSFVTGIALALAALPALGHGTWYPNSVDCSTSPCEIRYVDQTKYDSALSNAAYRWNFEPGGVYIAPYANSGVVDVYVRDAWSSDNWSGFYSWTPGPDNIDFNTRVLDLSDWYYGHEAKVALHEFGHALDFDHNGLSWSESIMPQGKRSQTYLGTHDKSDFAARWNS